MKIGIDAMGGDFAPNAMIEAMLNSLKNSNLSDVTFFIYGDENKINEILYTHQLDSSNLERVNIIHCTQIIDTDEKPIQAIKQKPDSSMVKGMMDLKNDMTDVFISSGNTGALLASATLKVGRIRGIKRPALTVIAPTYSGFKIILDVGANADCQPLYLQQFAIMGHFYAKFALGKENPQTYLINIGAEEKKGSLLYQEAHQLLKNTKSINFKGNIESIDIPTGEADVIVCDGFTGNIILKLSEGFMKMFGSALKNIIYKNAKTKLGGLMLKGGIKDFKARFDYSGFPVAPLLGIKKPVMKAHGNSDAKTFEAAIAYSINYAKSETMEKIANSIEAEDFQNTTES